MDRATLEKEQSGERPDSLDSLLETISAYFDPKDRKVVEDAFTFAEKCHRGQTRASGEPYILHPVEVAQILAEYRMDCPTIVAALLHDTVEDTEVSLVDIEENFGAEVRMLVDGVTKLTAIYSRQGREAPTPRSKQMARAENLRKIFLAMARDLRVILIKLADRLHNLRTLDILRPDKRERIASETLEIFAPIASRLGVFQMKRELQDLCFKYLHPEEYEELVAASERLREPREAAIEEAVAQIQEKLRRLNIEAQLEWREKHLYSTFQKMERTNRSLEEIYDLVALRVIVPRVEDCYSVLGAIHSVWIPMKDRIKDYIAVPKSNNYRSLHTTVYGPNHQPLEIQIRTWDMHRVNEFGIAAHWAYKEGSKPSKDAGLFKEIYPWIRAILDWQADSRDAREYIENLKLDLLSNEVFVFTPRGDVIDLPNGSCPIDFAYRIHTEVGHSCVGARANGKMVPLTYKLQNADILEIMTSKTGTPSLDWLRICKSTQARNKIKAWFKRERRDENVVRGREMLRRELGRQRMDNILSDNDMLTRVATRLNFVTVDDLLASLGYGETTLPQVLSRLRDELPKEVSQTLLPAPRRTAAKKGLAQAVRVKGMDNILVKFARCCAPVPGDPIVGYITLGKGVSVHVSDCSNFKALVESSPERFIEVAWDSPVEDPIYQVDIEIEAWDRSGLLSDVMNVINESKVPTRSCRAWARKDRACIKIAVEIAHKKQLEELMKKIRHLRDVIQVARMSQLRSK
ncbi:MAG: bifunctional (p)ppGpp synthetase/guanosine-3',5'-bis(diphosphate) 3'-pyrophosphohydrolase [Candidatus Eremiobacteraeota bacterium]|nr:bifunctional (p)ppGpp synthetase/guanosine-3',5'-bis(diphosphate) 3'-pyrophosphohydrolase [Candidatus Eremiobacteraeota bacterium]